MSIEEARINQRIEEITVELSRANEQKSKLNESLAAVARQILMLQGELLGLKKLLEPKE